MSRFWVCLCLGVVLVGCGGGELTEFAEQGETLVAELNTRIGALDAEWESQTPTAKGARAYWKRRIEARIEFLDGLQALDPPYIAVELHGEVVELFETLTSAEEALAAHVTTLDTVSEHWQWFDSPQGQAARRADEDIYGICEVVQQQFDSSAEREDYSDVAWLPSEMKEVVSVWFGCPP